jgi:UDP-N-acetylglucosamine 1-carboxyvinyltransferase
MDKFIINGGNRLKGEVVVSGAKNAALPILAASILATKPVIIRNVPPLRDVITIKKVLISLGLRVEFDTEKNEFYIEPAKDLNFEAPYELIKTMRASFFVMGPLLGKLKKAKVALPGGCAIGTRPVDLHIKGFEALGTKIQLGHGYVEAEADKLVGGRIYLDFPSVGATENIIMAAVLAEGKTIIENAAREPEIDDLIDFLNKLGAKISGAGTHIVEITGVKELGGCTHEVIPDRIEAGTFIAATGITGGCTKIVGTRINHLESILAKFNEVGMDFFYKSDDTLEVNAPAKLRGTDVKTFPYPGFPTDMQAQIMALMTVASGTSIITETVFENRFMHVAEFKRMGARISIKNHSAIVEGIDRLFGAPVMASDLRAGAALVLAGLNAEGETEISRVYHIDRGYDRIEDKLTKLGAEIMRVKE